MAYQGLNLRLPTSPPPVVVNSEAVIIESMHEAGLHRTDALESYGRDLVERTGGDVDGVLKSLTVILAKREVDGISNAMIFVVQGVLSCVGDDPDPGSIEELEDELNGGQN